MSKPANGKGIEAIAVKRATLADADKVRYRVYRDEVDFIAVIAESALMAMKVSGISTPHRIVRDLPSEGVAIEAKRMAKMDDTLDRVSLAVEPRRSEGVRMSAEMPERGSATPEGFVPMQVKDLQKKKTPWARVLTPDQVEQVQSAAKPAPAPAAPPPPPQPEPVTVEIEPAAPEPVMQAAPEPTPAEVASPPADPGVLSEEEVQKLLNS